MKSIREYQDQMRISPKESASFLNYLHKQKFDFDVYLPSIGQNLQRPLVWTLEQKRELINSIILNKHIPHLSIIHRTDDIMEVIDGKQRLSSIFEFLDGGFSVCIDEIMYTFQELPEDYQRFITRGKAIRYYLVNECDEDSITDQDKIQWFAFINFAGTPQDKEHMKNLLKTQNK
jgi:hypothetical protein